MATATKTTFLDLPGEIRNLIWEDVVTIKTPIGVLAPVVFPPDDERILPQPSLLKFREPVAARVSKSLRTEVLSIFYASNSFHVGRIPFRKPERQDGFTHEQYLRALKHWRQDLGDEEGARFLRQLDVGMVLNVRAGEESQRADGLEEDDCFFDQPFALSGRIERGRVTLSLTAAAKEYCCCDFNFASKHSGEEMDADGRCLVDAAIDICEKFAPSVKEGCCEQCQRTKLVR